MSAAPAAPASARRRPRGPALRRLVAMPLVVALGLGGVALLQARVDREARAQAAGVEIEERLFLPNERLLTHLTAGLRGIVADLLWLECIQYMSREFHDQNAKFAWLEHLSRTVTRLDPHFTGVYEYGGALLAGIGNDEGAMDLLRRGMVARPDRYEIPLEAAKVYVLNRRDEPGAAAAASFYLAYAAQLKGGDENLTRWAYNLQVRHGLTQVGREIWRDMAESGANEMLRELGRRKLIEMDLHDIVAALNAAADAFEAERGQRPADLQALADAGYVRGFPEDPLGGAFFVDSQGRVQNTTLLDVQASELMRRLRVAIAAFRHEQGRWPAALQELADLGYVKAAPRHPNEQKRFHYDPNTGELSDRAPES